MRIQKSTIQTLSLILALTLAGGITLRADFVCGDSKHPHPRSTGPTEADFSRFEWLTAEDQPSVTINHIIVSLADQRLYAFHDHQLLAWSNVSSGRAGHETPTGSFCVSEKDPDHHSSLYEDASMPFFMRLTDGGVGLHAGFLPGYPASHGCVRLPFDMARELFQRVDSGTPVEIISPSANLSAAPSAAAGVHLAQD